MDVKVKLQDHVLHIDHLGHVHHVGHMHLCACSCIILITIKSRQHFVGLQRFIYTIDIPMYTQFLSDTQTEREIVYVDTLVRKVIDGDTAVVVNGLVIENVRTGVSFYFVGCAYCKKRMIDDDGHGNLPCEIHACVNCNTYFLRVCFVESATGLSMWLTLFDQCMTAMLDVDAKDVYLKNES